MIITYCALAVLHIALERVCLHPGPRPDLHPDLYLHLDPDSYPGLHLDLHLYPDSSSLFLILSAYGVAALLFAQVGSQYPTWRERFTFLLPVAHAPGATTAATATATHLLWVVLRDQAGLSSMASASSSSQQQRCNGDEIIAQTCVALGARRLLDGQLHRLALPLHLPRKPCPI